MDHVMPVILGGPADCIKPRKPLRSAAWSRYVPGMAEADAPRDLVLLGAGHAHLAVLRGFARRPAPGLRITVIAREARSLHAGMLAGLIRGDCNFAEAHVDLAPLTAAAGAQLVVAEATAIDPVRRAVRLSGLREIGFDLLSIDIGAIAAMPPDAGTPVRPIGAFLHRLDAVIAALPPGGRLAIVGGGPAGTELALAVRRRFAARVVLVCASAEPLPAAPRRAQAIARAALNRAGVELAFGVRALGFADGRVRLSDGSALDAGAALWATEAVGPGLLRASGLACDQDGCVIVDRTLTSASHAGIFAAGDCAAIRGVPRPKGGVWAARAGETLAENLRRAAQGRRPCRWRPPRSALTILGLGDGTALAWRNGIAVSGAAVWRWKNRIDSGWMAQHVTPLDEVPAARQFRASPPG
jgi:selenide,water dikinase